MHAQTITNCYLVLPQVGVVALGRRTNSMVVNYLDPRYLYLDSTGIIDRIDDELLQPEGISDHAMGLHLAYEQFSTYG